MSGRFDRASCSMTQNPPPLRHMVFSPQFQAFRRRTPVIARLLVVLVALVYGWASYANIVSTSHDPATWLGHDDAPLLAAQSGGHDHDHDGSEPDDRSTGHQHGHHAADHSHDKPNLSGSETHAVLKLSDAWVTAPQVLAYPAPCYSFERPPRSLSMS